MSADTTTAPARLHNHDTDLLAWLRECVATERRVAYAASGRQFHVHPDLPWMVMDADAARPGYGCGTPVADCSLAGTDYEAANAAHLAMQDPERTLDRLEGVAALLAAYEHNPTRDLLLAVLHAARPYRLWPGWQPGWDPARIDAWTPA